MSKYGTIQSISDVTQNSKDGYVVKTDTHTVYVLIDNRQCCCESWGTIKSEDDLSYFIGSRLMDVAITDEFLKTKDIEEFMANEESGETRLMFVTFKTDIGDFQFVMYNDHNGYYGHEARVDIFAGEEKVFSHEEEL